MKKRTTCTILGANGYLGRHLTYYLHQAGFNVFAYDIQSERNPNIPSDIPYKQFDICNNYDQIRLDVDYLFVFSGVTGTKNGFDNYKTFIEVNEVGLLNILTEVKKMNEKPKIIFPSTRLVYKGQKHPLQERAGKEAKTIYAANKLACEYYLRMYANCFGITYTIYRICVPYGNLFDGEFSYGTVGAFLKRAKKGETISLYGNGSVQRTFSHVISICQQIADSMVLADSDNQTYNVAGETFSLKELAEKIAAVYKSKITFIPWNELDRKIESGSTVFDGKNISTIINVNAYLKLDEWLKKCNS